MAESEKNHFQILFHGCSIGAEPFSFVIQYFKENYDKRFSISCYATDKEKEFIYFSKNAKYPKDIVNGMDEGENAFFVHELQTVTVCDKARNLVHFLDPINFVNHTTNQKFDCVFLLNSLVYVNRQDQKKAIDSIAKYNIDFLVSSAFHSDFIKEDLINNDYGPILDNLEIIHESWIDRRISASQPENRPGIYADWTLPPFSKIADYEYRFCSIFQKINRQLIS
jgi:hypothetical protein